MSNPYKGRFARLRGIGLRTSVAVNTIVLLSVAGFIGFDAVRETREHVRERTAALNEEAMMLHRAVVSIAAEPERTQRYIDEVCARMSDESSPGHHIVVETGSGLYQARAHRRESDEIVRAIRSAASNEARTAAHGGTELVAGMYAADGARVYIAENLDDIHGEVRGRVVVRSLAVVLFGALLAIAVNLVLHRLVTRPLRRLVRTIEAIRSGKVGVRAGQFNTLELDRLAEAINEMSATLTEDAERRQRALDQARQVQNNLLPKSGGAVPGAFLAATHRAAEAVAGDYYDVLAAPDGSVVCCVADVVGHGVAAAMVAAIMKVLVLDAIERNAYPGEVVRKVNDRLMTVAPPGCFASLLVVRWCRSSQTFQYAGAGHEPGLLILNGSRTPLESTGTLLGLLSDTTWETKELHLPRGSVFVGLSDGVPEAMDADGILFGRKRLADVLDTLEDPTPERIVSAIDAAVQKHLAGLAPADDYTLLAVRLD